MGLAAWRSGRKRNIFHLHNFIQFIFEERVPVVARLNFDINNIVLVETKILAPQEIYLLGNEHHHHQQANRDTELCHDQSLAQPNRTEMQTHSNLQETKTPGPLEYVGNMTNPGFFPHL
jgi:hypothetical protein